MSPPSPEPAPDQITQPDQLDPAAAREFDPIDDERIVAVWRSHFGYLMLTSLRVVCFWRRQRLLGRLALDAREWHEGPDFYLFALSTPRVSGRFVELEVADGGDRASSARIEVEDPRSVASRIVEEIPRGRALWLARREQVRDRLRALRTSSPPPASGAVREVVRVVVRVPCRYCGSLMDEGDTRCPSCGAAQH